ncbi:MAG: orotidine-5'-phosphate decarboxylase [Planctomycetota bacterium]
MTNELSDHFGDRLMAAVRVKKTPLVVGLDPRFKQIPEKLRLGVSDSAPEVAEVFRKFCFEIIDVVQGLVPAVKPQAAFFEQLGARGMQALADVIDYAVEAKLMVILDAKRGDIGSTAEAYARAFLGRKPKSNWGCDGLTINPYLGEDTLEPFVNRANETGSGVFVLVKTSNPGSHSLQEKETHQGKVYGLVGQHVERLSAASKGESGYGSVGAVVGATYPEQLAELRSAMPSTIFLVPGFGAQGGTAKDVEGGFDENGLGSIVNSSRGIIFAHAKPEYTELDCWQTAVEKATLDSMDRLAETTAGKLRSC